jgi:very-short-patch-repair endonuclease
MTLFYNRKTEEHKRKTLRNNATPAEKKLWQALKGKSLQGFKFRRQYSVGPFILDFYCPELKLCIEVDGFHHDKPEVREYDKRRTAYIKQFGIRIIRFKNPEVLKNIHGVIEQLTKELAGL